LNDKSVDKNVNGVACVTLVFWLYAWLVSACDELEDCRRLICDVDTMTDGVLGAWSILPGGAPNVGDCLRGCILFMGLMTNGISPMSLC
jgi:hypothetical protein